MDMPIVPDCIFGTALASMQQKCEARKREDEALKLRLPRKIEPTPLAPLHRQLPGLPFSSVQFNG